MWIFWISKNVFLMGIFEFGANLKLFNCFYTNSNVCAIFTKWPPPFVARILRKQWHIRINNDVLDLSPPQLAWNFVQAMMLVLFLADETLYFASNLRKQVTHLYKQCCAWPHAIFGAKFCTNNDACSIFSRVKRCALSQTCANNDTYSKCLIAHHWHNINKYCKIKLCISKLSLRPREFIPSHFIKKTVFNKKYFIEGCNTCTLCDAKTKFSSFLCKAYSYKDSSTKEKIKYIDILWNENNLQG